MSGLIFIRHAETAFSGTFCGHSDPPLNARGVMQVADLVERLTSEAIEEIYCSDLLRATQTATPLAEAFAVPCTASSNLREINFGDWEAMTWVEIEKRDPNFARRWIASFPNLPTPGGEPFAVFRCRVLTEIEHLIRRAEHKRIAVVTHGGVMRMILREFFGRSEEEAWEATRAYCCSFVYAETAALQEVKS